MGEPTPSALRKRALGLADQGMLNHWEEGGTQLEAEGMAGAAALLKQDAQLRMVLNARCAQAKRK